MLVIILMNSYFNLNTIYMMCEATLAAKYLKHNSFTKFEFLHFLCLGKNLKSSHYVL